MVIPKLWHWPRKSSPSRRRCQPGAGCSFRVECLENRLPLSSGLSGAIAATTGLPGAEWKPLLADRSLAIEWTAVAADRAIEWSANSVPFWLATVEASSAAADTPTEASPNIVPSWFAGLETGSAPSLSLAQIASIIPADFVAIAPSGGTASALITLAQSGNAGSPGNDVAPALISELNLPSAAITLAQGGNFTPPPNDVATSLVAELNVSSSALTSGPRNEIAGVALAVTHDMEEGEFSGGPMAFAAAMPMGPAPWRGGTSASASDDEPDFSEAGTLETIDLSDGSFMSSSPASGRALWRGWIFRYTDPLAPVDASGEMPGTTVLSYLATTGTQATETALATSPADDVLSWAETENENEPVLPPAISAGGVSLSLLLGGPDLPVQDEPGGLEQVAELVPLPESSLALAATLWTVPSDALPAGLRSHGQPDKTINPDRDADAVSAWALFTTGVDQALEQTCRDIRDGLQNTGGRDSGTDSISSGRDDGIEWTRPLLPAGSARCPSDARPTGPTAPADLPLGIEKRAARTHQDTATDSGGDAPLLALATTPMLSVVSIGTAIVGWLWRQRKRSYRLQPGRTGSVGSWEQDSATDHRGKIAPGPKSIRQAIPRAFESLP
jgi:hypothetical protein